MGAGLIGDDAVWIDAANGLSFSAEHVKRIEARGLGILNADGPPEAPLSVIVDLARAEAQRLPERRLAAAPGGAVPLICGKAHTFLAAALRQYLCHGRQE